MFQDQLPASLSEIAGRAAALLATRLGDVRVRQSGWQTFHFDVGHGRLIVSATDELLLPSDMRTEARRTVAASEAPLAIITLHRPWDGVWAADTAAHIAYTQAGSLLAAELIGARLALTDDAVVFVAEDMSRALRIDADGWSLQASPAADDAFRHARYAALSAWQSWVADPAGVR